MLSVDICQNVKKFETGSRLWTTKNVKMVSVRTSDHVIRYNKKGCSRHRQGCESHSKIQCECDANAKIFWKYDANAMRCENKKSSAMRMRCDFFVAFFRIFAKCEKSHNAKNRKMRKMRFLLALSRSQKPGAQPCSKWRARSWACSLENRTDSFFFIIFALRIQPAGLSWACLSWPEISWVDLS